ncbi:MAG: hypothetical protein AAGD25_30695 [Cyanobacteria bacterium P01_F01_bin.150]
MHTKYLRQAALIINSISLAILVQNTAGIAIEIDSEKTGGVKSTVSCNAIIYSETDDGSVLITDGFPYQSETTLQRSHVITIAEVTSPGIFQAESSLVEFGGTVMTTSGGFLPYGNVDINQAVGITWEFVEQGIEFLKGDCKYIAQNSDAIIKFTQDGVIVTGFDIQNP